SAAVGSAAERPAAPRNVPEGVVAIRVVGCGVIVRPVRVVVARVIVIRIGIAVGVDEAVISGPIIVVGIRAVPAIAAGPTVRLLLDPLAAVLRLVIRGGGQRCLGGLGLRSASFRLPAPVSTEAARATPL